MQLTPATARGLGVDPANAAENVSGGARYLKALLARYDGDLVRALEAYNAGPGRADRWGGAPPTIAETRSYVAAILERLSQEAEGRVSSMEGAKP
jgi:soluble lytic murein transglycosylase-like protein